MRKHPPLPPRVAGPLVSLAAMALAIAGCMFGADATPQGTGRTEEIAMTVGKSVILDHPDEIARISIANPDVADAVAVSTKEVLINAKASGITTLVIWSRNGERNFFTLNVGANIQQIEQQIRSTFPGEDVQLLVTANAVSLTGHVSSQAISEKLSAMVAPLARTVVNNLSVPAAPADRQVLLKVRFAEVQKSVQEQLGLQILSTGAANTPGRIGTGQFGTGAPTTITGVIGAPVTGTSTNFTLGDVLNIFAFRPDLNLAAMIKDLEGKNLIQMLAEPNVVATSGKEAYFLVGGEFPFPVIQGGANAGAVTIQFREFGIKLNFLPQITTNQTIKLHVRPEVSALDFANALTISGFTIPAISTRRVETDVELAPGQSFVIAGLLDRSATEVFQKMPWLSSVPLLGNLLKSHDIQRHNSDLLVLVSPELPSAIAPGEKVPEAPFVVPFMPGDYNPLSNGRAAKP